MRYLLMFLCFGLIICSCSDDNPLEREREIEEEWTITDFTLMTTVENQTVTDGVHWSTYNGQEYDFDKPLIDTMILNQGARFDIEIKLIDNLVISNRDFTDVIRVKKDEYMFFFEFTDGIFSEPRGNGNIDNRDDTINYTDEDANGIPVGINTKWRAGLRGASPGELRVVLKHQPNLKTETSGFEDGETVIDITFPVIIL